MDVWIMTVEFEDGYKAQRIFRELATLTPAALQLRDDNEEHGAIVTINVQ